jgi:hypothetical protein
LISRTTARFKQAFGQMPKSVQRQARQKYELWSGDPRHPSIHFKLLKGQKNLWSVRVGIHYRALGSFASPDLFIWSWIGSHKEYDQLLKGRL